MARGDYAPEIKKALGTGKPGRVNVTPPKESLADLSRDKVRGIKEGSKQDQALDAKPANQAQPPRPPHPPQALGGAQPPLPPHAPSPAATPLPPDAHHVAAATSIAHAILNRSGGAM